MKKRYFVFGSIIFAAALIIQSLYQRERRVQSNYRTEFSGVIYNIVITSRKYSDVYVTDNRRCLLLKDLYRRDEGYIIKAGDSLIKQMNSSCFIYKRENKEIIRLCDLGYSIYFSDEEIKCVSE